MIFEVIARYTDYQSRSHFVSIDSDTSDRRHIEDLIKSRYPADKVYIQTVSQK